MKGLRGFRARQRHHEMSNTAPIGTLAPGSHNRAHGWQGEAKLGTNAFFTFGGDCHGTTPSKSLYSLPYGSLSRLPLPLTPLFPSRTHSSRLNTPLEHNWSPFSSQPPLPYPLLSQECCSPSSSASPPVTRPTSVCPGARSCPRR